MGTESVVVNTEKEQYEGLIVVGCDGAFSIVASCLGLKVRTQQAIAVVEEIRKEDDLTKDIKGKVLIDYGFVPMGYAWAFPKSNCINLGVGKLNGQRENWKEKLTEFKSYAGFSRMQQISALKAAIVPLAVNSNLRYLHRSLLLGDAAALVDPFTGEGIYPALLSASLAAPIIAREVIRQKPDFSSYQSALESNILSDYRYAWRLSNLLYPNSSYVHLLLQEGDFLIKYLAAILSGRITYRNATRFLRYFPQRFLTKQIYTKIKVR